MSEPTPPTEPPTTTTASKAVPDTTASVAQGTPATAPAASAAPSAAPAAAVATPAAPAAAAAAASAAKPSIDDDVEETKGEHQRVLKTQLGEMTELTSMCPTCEQNGTTRIMLTTIPHFREIIVSSFECANPDCRERNSGIEFGGTFGARHVQLELSVKNLQDMNRQIVKSEHAVITIPELELELPRETQKGSLNTIEGLLVKTIEGLQFQQVVRRAMHPELAVQIDAFCAKLESYRGGTIPFTVKIDDPSGNSYIEPYFTHYHPTIDPQISRTEFPRTDEDRNLLGLEDDYNTRRTVQEETAVDDGELEEVIVIPEECSACRRPGELRMHKCDIPYFQETLIMSFRCEFCGFRSSEVKNGGPISAHGLKIQLAVRNETDLKRDVLKSNSATLTIPEIDLELAPGTLGGFFSSVEGVLVQVFDKLSGMRHAEFATGDSGAVDTVGNTSQSEMARFLRDLQELRDGTRPFTLILDDPLANIYIQNPRAHLPPPENEDPQLVVEQYTRTFDQDEELGLHQMQC